MLTPEEQEALLGNGSLLAGETAPLSDEEQAAIYATEQLPVTEGPTPKVDQVVSGKAAPMEAIPPQPEPEHALPTEQELAKIAPPKQAPPAPAPQTERPPIATAKPGESKLVPTKPEWYDYVAPPKIDGSREAAGSLFGGLLSAFTADSGKDAFKNLFGGIAGAANAGLSAPQRDYQNRLDAASKQANMFRSLNSGQGGGDSELDWLKFGLSKERLQGQQDELARKLELERRLNDLNSEETRKQQEMAIQNGMPEEEARKKTGAQILKWRAQIGAANRQDEGNQNAFDRISLQDHLRKQAEGREEGRTLEGEERKRVASLEEADIPGVEWINPRRPPESAAVNKVRELHGARESLIDAATRLAELQKKVRDPVAQTLAGWNSVFGDVEQGDILQEMKFLREQLAADQRVIWNQGVPHEFDLRVNKKTNPEADSPFTFFTGEGAWGAMARTADRRADLMMKSLGARRQGTETPSLGPVPQRGSVGQKDLSNEVRKGGATSQRATQEVTEAAGAALGNAKQAAKTIAIQIQDPVSKAWSSTRQVTEEQYRNIMKKLAERGIGPGAVRRAQP